MTDELHALRNAAPDLAGLDPLAAEVRAWLDKTHDAVRRVDPVEAVVFKLHEQSLSDRTRRVVASAEIAGSVERALRTSQILAGVGTAWRPAGS